MEAKLNRNCSESDSSLKEQFTNHNAGLDGGGGSSYIDLVVMRDKGANTAWATASADGVLEERRYLCQNWRGDVSAIVTDAGKMVEWVKYSAYGVPFGLPCGDTDSHGDWDATDSAAITGTLDARKDCNLDGTVSAADVTQTHAIRGGYQTLGRTVMSSASVSNRKGYAGCENDGSIWRLDQVRNRVLHAELGRWLQRDPSGYVDGMSLYEYVASRAVAAVDPTGLQVEAGDPCKACDACKKVYDACVAAALAALIKAEGDCLLDDVICTAQCILGCAVIGVANPAIGVICYNLCAGACALKAAWCILNAANIYRTQVNLCQAQHEQCCPCVVHN